jgi:sec-independent protein translocase protein TatA
MGLSLPHLIILAIVVLVLFGRGRISEMMGDFGKGIKSFKQGMNEEANPQPTPPPAQISPPVQASQPQQPQQQQAATLNGETVIDPSQAGPR